MDQNNGQEAKVSKEKTRTLLIIDLGEVPQLPTRISLQDPNLHMGTMIRKLEGQMTKAQISHSIKAMETDLEMILSTIRMEIGESMEDYPILHRLKAETFHKIFHTTNRKVTNLTTLPSADLTIDL